jgi:ABC-type branched-subunit amino acid transport system ATPase component
MSTPILETRGLTRRFGGLTAVDNLSLSLEGGKLHAIIGPNGAGKTTFFNLVSGLLRPDSGEVISGAATSPACQPIRLAGSASSGPFRSKVYFRA